MQAQQKSRLIEHPSKLCDVCSLIFVPDACDLYSPRCQGCEEWYFNPFSPDIAKEVAWYPLHQSRQIYEQGLASECELCDWITTIAPDGTMDFSTSFLVTRERLWISILVASTRLSFHRNVLQIDVVPQPFDVWQPPNGTTAVQRIAVATIKSPSTSSHETLRLASSWLGQCTTHHPHCAPMEQPSWYPTRLLQVSGQDVKLVVTSEQQVQGAYFTLSHCWGVKPPRLMLTQDTASMLADGLPVDSLEPTYRDALDITRSLGCKYLWIDLFCIFQGTDDLSKQDWARESVLMDKVYAGCALNISAADARDGNGGCYSQRVDEHVLRPIVVS